MPYLIKLSMIFLFPVKRNVFSSQNFYNLLQKDLMGSVLLTYFQQQDKYIELLFKRQNHYVLSDKIKKEFLLLISENVKPNTKVYEKIEILLEYQISASVRCHLITGIKRKAYFRTRHSSENI